ncbi:MAG: PAS domain S-box protein [Bryobacterales bacterium]|nr:PAS domain S-box protein [Bryobacterales bacterium]
MLPPYLSSPAGSRVANLALTLLITATASVAAPAQPSSLNALSITLGCLCVVLLALTATLWFGRKPRPTALPAPVIVPGAAEIVKNARDAIFVIQESGEILSTNPSAEKLFGYSFAELRGKSISALIPPPARGRARANYIHAAEGRELIGVRRAGERFPLDLVLSELPGHADKRFSVIVRDRSERNRAEFELETQRRFAASLIDNLPALLVVIDHEGRVVRFNRTCEDFTQFSEGELRRQYLWQAVSAPAEMEAAERQVLEVLAGDFPSRTQSNWCLRDNSIRVIAWTHNALRDEFGRLTHVVSTGADITDSLQLADRRREAASLQTAGRLAGGIAHDFNNLLTAITGYSGLALVNLDHSDPVRNDIEEIKRASDRGASLTRQLLTFSGNHPRTTGDLDLNDAVRRVERLVRVMAGDSIHVDLSLENNLPLVRADAQLIEECIMHLVANAKEAMANGGTLQIQTGVRSLTRTRLDARPPVGPGEYITLSVVDTGAGIPPEAIPHIFEPFYTTKQSPVSNGMGLAMVYGIVRQAEGSIVVHSAPKYGSTFRVFLPMAPNQAPRTKNEPPSEASLQGDETVLLAVESDQERKKLRETLESAGYAVLDARSGLQALEIAHKSTCIIHLLVTDIALPRMSGPALAESVVERIPAIRVLFATSRGAAEIERHGLNPAEVLRLDRTLDRRFVLLRIRESLSTKTSQ